MSKTILKTFQLLLFTIIIGNGSRLYAQEFLVRGQLVDSVNAPVSDALVRVFPDSISLTTDQEGQFEVYLSRGKHIFQFTHVNFETYFLETQISNNDVLQVELKSTSQVLKNVEISDSKFGLGRDAQLTSISAKTAKALPSATGDFTKVLATLPGVAANNELSSAYSVRGGNYDENLVYVNGIKIYRPQIVSAGRQEGLSFINPDLVRSVDFSAGAWRANYGDKLSSVLDVSYREPIHNEATLNMSLLGGSAYAGGSNKNRDISYTLGIRHKNSKYLLGTLDTEGQYLPKFTDFQSFVTKRISNRTKIGILASAAINNYQTIPSFQQTDFGTIQASYRLNVAFEGQELLEYQTYQAGAILTHALKDYMFATLIVSGVKSSEREYYDINGGYRLCDLNINPSSDQFNQCASIRGIGTNYAYGRNKLEAEILNVTFKTEVFVNNDILEYGVDWDLESIDDQLREYSYIDSADFVNVTALRNSDTDITSHKLGGFIQYTLVSKDSVDFVNAGVRVSYWSYSNQFLLSPRFQYIHKFGKATDNSIRFGLGIYQQHPFYRELRDRDGVVNPNVKAQSSAHVVAGWDRYFRIWNRPFKMTFDAYFKYLWNVNRYDVDNVKIRYFADNDAVANTYGFDFRINGEFIPGLESWFSLGILRASEAGIYTDSIFDPNQGKYLDVVSKEDFTRRPTDQRLNIGILFQDYLPNDPTMRVSLNLLFGSGLPFGPPGNDEFRNAFNGDKYTRVDLGLTKTFSLLGSRPYIPKTIQVGVEVLNLLGTQNAISYTWIEDTQGINYAVPNDLSMRFYNLRVIANF